MPESAGLVPIAPLLPRPEITHDGQPVILTSSAWPKIKKRSILPKIHCADKYIRAAIAKGRGTIAEALPYRNSFKGKP